MAHRSSNGGAPSPILPLPTVRIESRSPLGHRVQTQLGIGYRPAPAPVLPVPSAVAAAPDDDHAFAPMELAAVIPRPSAPPFGFANEPVKLPMHPTRVKYALFGAGIFAVLLTIAIVLGTGKSGTPAPAATATPVVAVPVIAPPAPVPVPVASQVLPTAHPASYAKAPRTARAATPAQAKPTTRAKPAAKATAKTKSASRAPALDLKVPKAKPAEHTSSAASQFGSRYGRQ
jgi:hypothetical protein